MDVDECNSDTLAPDNQAYVEVEFFTAVNKNDLDTVDRVLTEGRVDVNKFNIMHKAAIYFAVQNESVPMVELLISHNADLGLQSYCNIYCNYETPLITAARIRNMELVELLLAHGCALECSSDTASLRRDYKSALQWAAGFGDLGMAELLLAHGADVNWVGPHFFTALHYAAAADQCGMVEWLVSRGARATINGDARTPLHISAARGNFAITKFLLQNGCRPDARDCFSFTPFGLACLRGHAQIVQFIYDNYASAFALDLNDGLQRAAECGYAHIMAYLIEKGADVNARNQHGETAISIAAHGRVGQKHMYGAVKLLIDHGACINVVESRGHTPLTMSLLREEGDIAALLIKHGAALDAVSDTVECPLFLAFSTSNALLVKYLIQAGCHFCTQPWFNGKAASEKITEMDFLMPGPTRFRRDSGRQKETWRWIKSRMGQPRSLAQLTRRCVRQYVSARVTSGASVLPVIEALPLPTCIRKYLALEDVLQEQR